jgi:hypothetical protein
MLQAGEKLEDCWKVIPQGLTSLRENSICELGPAGTAEILPGCSPGINSSNPGLFVVLSVVPTGTFLPASRRPRTAVP